MADWFSSARRWRSAYGRWRYSWDGRAPASLLLVALLLGLVLGLWWGRWSDEGGSAPSSSSSDRARLSEGTARAPETGPGKARQTATSPQAGPADARFDHCQEVYDAQARPLEAVPPAMAQWEVHIGAMNKLVAGAISLAQVKELWSQTRTEAARNLAELEDARRSLDRTAERCTVPVTRASADLRRCAAAVAIRQRQLDRAAVPLDAWHHHVRHMEMLRRGELAPEAAMQRWLQGADGRSRAVEAYRGVARDAQPGGTAQRAHHGGAGGPCA